MESFQSAYPTLLRLVPFITTILRRSIQQTDNESMMYKYLILPEAEVSMGCCIVSIHTHEAEGINYHTYAK